MKTTKGKGVSYMEDNAGWHGKAPNDIDVGDDAQVVQLIVGGEHGGLPDLALGQLAIAQQRVDIEILPQVLGARA